MKLIRYEYPQLTPANAFNRLFDFGATERERFESLFDGFFGAGARTHQPGADLYEDAQGFYLRMELPGVKKDSIDLELENSVLTLRHVHSEKTEGGESTGSFQRSVAVPDGVELAKVSASMEDGILTVSMPKEAAKTPRQIQIK